MNRPGSTGFCGSASEGCPNGHASQDLKVSIELLLSLNKDQDNVRKKDIFKTCEQFGLACDRKCLLSDSIHDSRLVFRRKSV